MRCLRLVILCVLLSGCNSMQAAKDAANEEYAIGSYEQSLEAYQICAARHAGEPQKCAALARVIDADKKRYEKVTGN